MKTADIGLSVYSGDMKCFWKELAIEESISAKKNQ